MKPRTLHQKLMLMGTLALAFAAGFVAAGRAEAGFSFGDAAGKNAPCLACHADPGKVKGTAFIDPVSFGHTTHARIGCSSCHDGVSKEHPGAGKSPRTDCTGCHADVGEEYAGSVHGKNTGCTGCHNPHKVSTPREISGQEINRMCSGCHNGFQMTAKHGEWLPQADLHLRMLPCITCHTAAKEYFISMYIVKGRNGSRFGQQELASHADLKKLAGGREIVSLIDVNGDRYVSVEELRMFNHRNSAHHLRLQGMMTPDTASHKFEFIDNRRNCTFCHGSGPNSMQTSFIALPAEDGTFIRMPVEKGAVLDALYGTPDFYMMGSTKNGTLNLVGAAVICGGLIMPVGHGFLRFLTRKNRKGKEGHQS